MPVRERQMNARRGFLKGLSAVVIGVATSLPALKKDPVLPVRPNREPRLLSAYEEWTDFTRGDKFRIVSIPGAHDDHARHVAMHLECLRH